MIPCPTCERMTRRGGVCGHCDAPLPRRRLRTDVSVAAITLGLVGLTGCELFDNTVGKALGWSAEQTDGPIQQGEIYGVPPSEDTDVPMPEDLQQPDQIYGEPDPSLYEEPGDIYGVPGTMLDDDPMERAPE